MLQDHRTISEKDRVRLELFNILLNEDSIHPPGFRLWENMFKNNHISTDLSETLSDLDNIFEAEIPINHSVNISLREFQWTEFINEEADTTAEFEYENKMTEKYSNLEESQKEKLIIRNINVAKDLMKEYLILIETIMNNLPSNGIKEFTFTDQNFVIKDLSILDKYIEKSEVDGVIDYIEALKVLIFGKTFSMIHNTLVNSESKLITTEWHENIPILFKFYLLNYKILLNEVLFPKNIDNHFLKQIKSIKPEFYIIFHRAITDKLILKTGDKYNFTVGPGAIRQFFNDGEFNKWTLIKDNILSNNIIVEGQLRNSSYYSSTGEYEPFKKYFPEIYPKIT